MKQVQRYDRQIRAWGFDTQKKLENCKILSLGFNLSCFECFKNLILAGSGSVHISADNIDKEYKEILLKLNPNCEILFSNIEETMNNVEYLMTFDVIVLFNTETHLVNDFLSKGKVVLLCKTTSILLMYNVSEYPTDVEAINKEVTTVFQATLGGLLSQIIVDYLPPLESPLMCKLVFDPETLETNAYDLLN